jgi:hypothetical protein
LQLWGDIILEHLHATIAFLTSLLLPPDNKKLFCHHRTHQQTIA